MAEAVVGVDEKQLTSTWLAGGKIDVKYFGKVAKGFFDKIKNLKPIDFRNWLSSVKGGAVALWETISKGQWGTIKDWFKNAPLLPKMAAVVAGGLALGVVVIAGGAVIGAVAAGIGTLVGSLGLGGAAALSTVLPQLLGAATQATSFAYNFNWAQSDKELMTKCKTALESLYEPAGEAIGRSLAAVVAGRFGQSVSQPKLVIREKTVAAVCMLNPTIKDALIDALSDLRWAVQQVGKVLLFNLAYLNVRKIAARFFGKENEWGKEGADPFIISEKVNKVYEKVKESEFFSWVSDKQWEAAESGVESFFDTLGELITDQGTYEEWVPA